MIRRYGFWSYEAPTCQTSHSMLEQRAGERQRAAPLPGAGLGREPLDAGLGVVERLRHGGVRLVRPDRRDALVLVVDPGRCAERLLEPPRAEHRRRPPHPVDVLHLDRDVDEPLARDLLLDQRHREQRCEVVRPDRLERARVQRRRRRGRQVRHDVVPPGRHPVLVKKDLATAGQLGHEDSSGQRRGAYVVRTLRPWRRTRWLRCEPERSNARGGLRFEARSLAPQPAVRSVVG